MTKRIADVEKTADLQCDRKDQKRRREARDDSDGAPSLPVPLPDYGTKDYWDNRYRNHGVDGADGSQKVDDGSPESPEAGHCWYFSYSELRSLVLPLLLGSENHELCQSDLETDDDDVEEWVVEGEDDDQDEWVEAEASEGPGVEPSSEPINQAGGEKDAKQDDKAHEDEEEGGEGEEGGDEEDEEEEEFNLDNAQCSIPKKVLEIGCGDVPLGSGLVDDLMSMQSQQSTKLAKSVVEEVTCIDYSEIVVQNLISEQKGGGKCKKSTDSLEVKYEIVDARKLPYDANSYDLIFEKGTMDAMLSDASEGVQNCIQIVCEMARVCSPGGSILIVSHLNANDPKGMDWLRDVVVRGLEREFQQRNGAKTPPGDEGDACEYVWFISVNGGEGEVVDDEEEELGFRSTYGPAVYILTKKTIPRSLALELYGKPRGDGPEDCRELDELPPVKIEFVEH